MILQSAILLRCDLDRLVSDLMTKSKHNLIRLLCVVIIIQVRDVAKVSGGCNSVRFFREVVSCIGGRFINKTPGHFLILKK